MERCTSLESLYFPFRRGPIGAWWNEFYGICILKKVQVPRHNLKRAKEIMCFKELEIKFHGITILEPFIFQMQYLEFDYKINDNCVSFTH